jgi:inner membrane protein
VVVVLAVQPILQGHLDVSSQFLTFGFVDWLGHLATGVVLIAVLRPSRRTAAAILVGSVILDLDHLPHEFGTDVLTAGTPRPYSHSLLSVVVVLAVAGVARSPVLLGVAIGFAGHLLRDVGTGGGVPLLWPLSDGGAVVPFWVYVVVLALLAAGAVLRPRRRAAGAPAR